MIDENVNYMSDYIKKILASCFLILALFLMFKLNVKADEEVCSDDSGKKAIKYENKEFCYGDNEAVYCNSNYEDKCFIIDKSDKQEDSTIEDGGVAYGTTFRDNAKLLTVKTDNAVKESDKWWSSVSASYKRADFTWLKFIGSLSGSMGGQITDGLLSLLEGIIPDTGAIVYTDAFAGKLKSLEIPLLSEYENTMTFEVRGIPKEKQVNTCMSLIGKQSEIEEKKEEYSATHSAAIVTEYKKLVDDMRTFCSKAIKSADYNDACMQMCIELEKDIYESNKAFGIEDKGQCGLSGRLIAWILNILKWIKYIIPVAVIIFGSLDFIKATASEKDDDMKKAQGNFIKRLIAAALIFLIPLIIEFILPKFGFDYYSCGIF